jgi:SAM-dependent methyltransferase
MERPAGSRSQPSLDEIVTRSAAAIADQIRRAAALAKSEMDLQIDVAAALKKFAGDAKITLEGHHNVTIATGRPDSVYGSVIVEYKEPGKLSPNKDAAPNKAVIDQLKKRFYDMRREEHRQWNSMFGVGTDGKYFIFLRFRDDKWTDQEPLEVNRYSTERFLWALYNLGQKGKPYQPEYLNGDFGSGSQTAQEGARVLYEEILNTTNPKAQVFFNQWKILFGEVCGYDVENLSDKLNKLAEFYLVKGKPQPAQLLFAVHTYYAILIKLLASEIVSFLNPWMTRQVEKLQSANSSAKLKRELEELEQGGVFHTLGITNFLEGDLFAWYLGAWSAPVEKLVRAMVTKLDLYNPGTFSEDPAQSRDLLKKLYHQLFPKSVRHDLGEYYTPDWLAEHVLNELGYEGNPDKRLLDPACGSGTFLVMAINRIRHWYDDNREKCAYDEGDLLKKILTNVIGFDLNPLAVMTARTNYLVAIKDLIRHVEAVEIPVYLCDSVMTPAEYGDLFTGGQGNVAKVPCSAMKPPHLLVPKEIAESPREVAKYADVLEKCIKNAYAPDEFLSRCSDEGLNITATDAHIALYKELVRLDKENKNGIWARIIKNNFAPLFVGRVNYVAGNPPWVNWENLPQEYRQSTAPLWQAYDLFQHKGYKAKLGGAKDDISVLMTYVAHDCYLIEGGSLGFVITLSVFKTKGAGEGFRRFQYRNAHGQWFLPPLSVHDLSTLQPFEGAVNRTATFVVGKARTPFTYPVRYVAWFRGGSGEIAQDDTLQQVYRKTERQVLAAEPIDSENPASPWLTSTESVTQALRKVRGRSDYGGRKGIGARISHLGHLGELGLQ